MSLMYCLWGNCNVLRMSKNVNKKNVLDNIYSLLNHKFSPILLLYGQCAAERTNNVWEITSII